MLSADLLRKASSVLKPTSTSDRSDPLWMPEPPAAAEPPGITRIEATDPNAPKPPGATRFVLISDTHGKHESLTIPEGDVLIHAGDFTDHGQVSQLESFFTWLASVPCKHKIVIAGNHDVTLDSDFYEQKWKRFHKTKQSTEAACDAVRNCIYLRDSLVEVEGFKIYGSPYQPEFAEWAFNLPRGPALRNKWSLIPEGTDVLVTHGPPMGHGDLCLFGGYRCGCEDLLKRIEEVRPKLHVFGHVHEGYGITSAEGLPTLFVNASSCTFKYRAENRPLLIDLYH
eukprot:TRINITY_DN11286_c0_g1_i1.p1 TRINITY_DN11286_c0_g1~~TRINITY_DN11286_c0_g1_i1.p1  ORF type:complete len:283 (+),score=22.61 TRINITY_DN11286_c0_g1_i1:528-1376(+)